MQSDSSVPSKRHKTQFSISGNFEPFTLAAHTRLSTDLRLILQRPGFIPQAL